MDNENKGIRADLTRSRPSDQLVAAAQKAKLVLLQTKNPDEYVEGAIRDIDSALFSVPQRAHVIGCTLLDDHQGLCDPPVAPSVPDDAVERAREIVEGVFGTENDSPIYQTAGRSIATLIDRIAALTPPVTNDLVNVCRHILDKYGNSFDECDETALIEAMNIADFTPALPARPEPPNAVERAREEKK